MSHWLRAQILRFVCAMLLVASCFAYSYDAETMQDAMLFIAGILFGMSMQRE